MGKENSGTPDVQIQSIYSSFLKCISDENSSDSKSASSCLRNVLSKLEQFRKTNQGRYNDKVNTLTNLIETKIQNIEKGAEKQLTQEDYERKFAELGVRFISKPTRTFKDVQGLDQIKKTLQINVIYPLKFNDLSKEFGIRTNGGILFYGPPGNGKTLLAEALAGEAGINFLELNPAYLYNELFGRFEKNISEIFKLAKDTSPNVLFFDEVETLIPRRESTDHSVVKRGVTQLLIEINKMLSDDQNKTYLVAATNLPWDIDPAMLRPGRFDLKIYVPLPKQADREAIIGNRLQSTAFSKNIDVKEVASATENFSVSDLDFIMRQSAENVFYEAIESGKKRQVTRDDILTSISKIKPSSTLSLIERYNNFL